MIFIYTYILEEKSITKIFRVNVDYIEQFIKEKCYILYSTK